MKKIILAFAFLLSAQFAMAQDDAFKKDVMKLMEVNGSSAQLDIAKNQILKMIPADKQAAFLIEFNATLPAFNEKVAEAYMQVYSKEDIKGMLKFYNTPLGKKMASKAGDLAEKSTAAGQEWGASLQPMLMKYLQE